MHIKTEIGSMSAGQLFYFFNDPLKNIWRVLKETRKDSASKKFRYCENVDTGEVQDWNFSREVYNIHKREDIPAQAPVEDKLPPVNVLVKKVPAARREFIHTPINLSTNTEDMDHKQASVKIYYSTNYSDFRMINGNRELNALKINRIITAINSGNDMLQYYPIQVKEVKDRLEILDGQHRFFICKKLKRPVYYILVVEEKSMVDIANINSNVDKWKPKDYINCYMQHGNDNYEKIQQFIDKYGTSLSITLQLLDTGTPGKDKSSHRQISNEFHAGKFIVNHYETAEALLAECLKFEPFPYCKSRSFVIAVWKIIQSKLVTVDEVVEAYQKSPEMLSEQANYKAYINTLEQIINVRKRQRVIIAS